MNTTVCKGGGVNIVFNGILRQTVLVVKVFSAMSPPAEQGMDLLLVVRAVYLDFYSIYWSK